MKNTQVTSVTRRVAGHPPPAKKGDDVKPSPMPRKPPPEKEESEPAAAEVPSPEKEDMPAKRAPRRIAAAAVVVLLAGAAGFAGWQWYRQELLDTARDEASAAAGKYAVDLTSYDFGKLDENFETVAGNSTAAFAQQYQETTNGIKPLLLQYKAVSKSTVLQSGIVNATADRVVAVLFVDQTITNTNSPQARVDRNRVELTLVHQDGRWLIDGLQLR
ncbi:hypothetical protein ACFQ05_02340 [Amycolatopsis umgeniensis]|uniref:Mce-associated membrane protein n=1 Tax=Amycolatopsis umgeniensis TaxID=336628 RepID=A0A841AYS6_9PSEU|nr:hypothetical protein [Amycolatopsis umgeniensis]MBB5852097.1 Mce-associated membrane protein [Amycolatopsis umgeniensis]